MVASGSGYVEIAGIVKIFSLIEGLPVSQEGLCPMDSVDWLFSSVPTGLVGKQRTNNHRYCERQQNRSTQVSDVYWLHGAEKDIVMKGLSLDRLYGGHAAVSQLTDI